MTTTISASKLGAKALKHIKKLVNDSIEHLSTFHYNDAILDVRVFTKDNKVLDAFRNDWRRRRDSDTVFYLVRSDGSLEKLDIGCEYKCFEFDSTHSFSFKELEKELRKFKTEVEKGIAYVIAFKKKFLNAVALLYIEKSYHKWEDRYCSERYHVENCECGDETTLRFHLYLDAALFEELQPELEALEEQTQKIVKEKSRKR